MFPKGPEHTIYQNMLEERQIEETKKSKEYQEFVKKKLGDRDLGDMNDEETKAFFAKIDKEWNSESEKGKDGNKAAKDESVDPEESLEGLDSALKKDVQKLAERHLESFEEQFWEELNSDHDPEMIGENAQEIIKMLKKITGDFARKMR